MVSAYAHQPQSEQTAMIGIGEYRVGSFPMMTIGLGSCIGLTMYDPNLRLGAMVHIMLPESAGRMDRPGKYVDTAVPLLVKELVALGCKNRSIIAKIAGGACMFEYFGTNLNIGERNAVKVRLLLKELMRARFRSAELTGHRAVSDYSPRFSLEDVAGQQDFS
jgi:chemotaxis protein CheD